MYNALGVVAQLVRASACHAEGRGFEPRQSRQYLHRHHDGVFSCLLLKIILYNYHYRLIKKEKHMKFKLLAIGACTLALAACGDNGQNPDALKGISFVSAQPGVDITLTFDPQDMRVYGKVVNQYNGGYTADGDNIKFEGFASTMMMGAPEAMETEAEYFQFMPTVETYELSDGKLTLVGENGKEIIFTQVEVTPTETVTAEEAEVVTE